jgi:hypothetical protein
MRGRPGTRALPLAEARAVGGPIPLGLLAAYAAVALTGWLAAAVALIVAAPDLADRDPLAEAPVLATHLIAVGVLPFAVTAASFHLLPVMLRNDIGRPPLLRAVLPLLAGGFLVAPGLAFDRSPLVWAGAGLVTLGLLLVLSELAGLVRRAPRGRTLVASRTGVALVCVNVTGALVLGALVFSHGDDPVAGVDHDRWVVVHLNLALLGWLTLLIVTVGRTLAPMLAVAPTAPPRRLPLNEAALTAGLWVMLAGVAASSTPIALVGGSVVAVALGAFGAFVVRVGRTRRIELEGPLAHMIVGVGFLLQAAVLGFLVLAHAVSPARALTAYVVFLLVGWAAGVTIGHLGKLLSLSLWVWWPPGPRPKQAALYPRPTWIGEAVAFGLGAELLGLGSLTGSSEAARAGTALLLVSAALAAAGAAQTWRRRAGPTTRVPPGGA